MILLLLLVVIVVLLVVVVAPSSSSKGQYSRMLRHPFLVPLGSFTRPFPCGCAICWCDAVGKKDTNKKNEEDRINEKRDFSVRKI